MKETVICSDFLNQTEFLRTLAQKGKSTLGIRVLNTRDLCDYIAVRNGISFDRQWMTPTYETVLFSRVMASQNGGTPSLFDDARNMANAVSVYRDFVSDDVVASMEQNLRDDFPEKKNTLLNTYRAYEAEKEANCLMDTHDVMNILLSGITRKIPAECVLLRERPVGDVMRALVNKAFDTVTEKKVTDYVTANPTDVGGENVTVVRAYGRSNEVDYVLREIKDENLNITDCVIVPLSEKYVPYLSNALQRSGLKYTSELGESILTCNAGQLLKELNDLDVALYGETGYGRFFDSACINTSPLREKFTSGSTAFDAVGYREFIKYAGWLRISPDGKRRPNASLYTAEIFAALDTLYHDMCGALSTFVNKYARNDRHKFAVVMKIREMEDLGLSKSEIINILTDSRIGSEIPSSDAIHISSLQGALASGRSDIVVVGLNSDFPGTPKENYLLFDDELKRIGALPYLSDSIVTQKKELLLELKQSGKRVILTYPYFIADEIKQSAPSSVITEWFDTEKIPTYSYRSAGSAPIIAYLDHKVTSPSVPVPSLTYNPDVLLSKTYRASSFAYYFTNRYEFILTEFLGIRAEEEKDPYEIIPANEKGTLIHDLMKDFQKTGTPDEKDIFLKKAETDFGAFLQKKPPLIEASVRAAKNDCLSLAGNLFDMMDPGARHYKSEEALSGAIGGVRFEGRFDRIEQMADGTYAVIDFKTGKHVSHSPEDLHTCVQGLIYAYLAGEAYGINVSTCIFRYPANMQDVIVPYDREQLLSIVQEFVDGINSGDFACDSKGLFTDKYDRLRGVESSFVKGGT